MKQEFVTSRGKVIVENNELRIRNQKARSKDGFYFALMNAVWMIAALERGSKAMPLIYLGLICFGMYILFELFQIFFINSWSNRVELDEIRSYQIVRESDLEVTVVLKLKNGRKKEIAFRTLEKQYEPFVELIYQHQVQLQLA